MTPPPTPIHNKAASRLNRLLTEYLIQSGDGGEVFFPRTGIIRGPSSWLEPDLFYVAAETDAYLDPGYPNQMSTADLAIEIISPSSAIYDRNTKADTYAALGVKELWLVDEGAGMIEVRTLEGNRYASSVVLEGDDYIKSSVLPGFKAKVSKVFGS